MSEENLIKQEENVKPKKKVLFEKFFSKLKTIKHLDKILIVLFISIILLIYFSTFSTSEKSSQKTGENGAGQVLTETTFESYVSGLENKLCRVLSSIKNVGKVNVALYFDSGFETVIAYKTETQTLSNGTVVEVKSPVLIKVNGEEKPVVLQENCPEPRSIIVVATGANDTNVKLEILRVVQTMFSCKSSSVEIFAGN